MASPGGLGTAVAASSQNLGLMVVASSPVVIESVYQGLSQLQGAAVVLHAAAPSELLSTLATVIKARQPLDIILIQTELAPVALPMVQKVQAQLDVLVILLGGSPQLASALNCDGALANQNGGISFTKEELNELISRCWARKSKTTPAPSPLRPPPSPSQSAAAGMTRSAAPDAVARVSAPFPAAATPALTTPQENLDSDPGALLLKQATLRLQELRQQQLAATPPPRSLDSTVRDTSPTRGGVAAPPPLSVPSTPTVSSATSPSVRALLQEVEELKRRQQRSLGGAGPGPDAPSSRLVGGALPPSLEDVAARSQGGSAKVSWDGGIPPPLGDIYNDGNEKTPAMGAAAAPLSSSSAPPPLDPAILALAAEEDDGPASPSVRKSFVLVADGVRKFRPSRKVEPTEDPLAVAAAAAAEGGSGGGGGGADGFRSNSSRSNSTRLRPSTSSWEHVVDATLFAAAPGVDDDDDLTEVNSMARISLSGFAALDPPSSPMAPPPAVVEEVEEESVGTPLAPVVAAPRLSQQQASLVADSGGVRGHVADIILELEARLQATVRRLQRTGSRKVLADEFEARGEEGVGDSIVVRTLVLDDAVSAAPEAEEPPAPEAAPAAALSDGEGSRDAEAEPQVVTDKGLGDSTEPEDSLAAPPPPLDADSDPPSPVAAAVEEGDAVSADGELAGNLAVAAPVYSPLPPPSEEPATPINSVANEKAVAVAVAVAAYPETPQVEEVVAQMDAPSEAAVLEAKEEVKAEAEQNSDDSPVNIVIPEVAEVAVSSPEEEDAATTPSEDAHAAIVTAPSAAATPAAAVDEAVVTAVPAVPAVDVAALLDSAMRDLELAATALPDDSVSGAGGGGELLGRDIRGLRSIVEAFKRTAAARSSFLGGAPAQPLPPPSPLPAPPEPVEKGGEGEDALGGVDKPVAAATEEGEEGADVVPEEGEGEAEAAVEGSAEEEAAAAAVSTPTDNVVEATAPAEAVQALEEEGAAIQQALETGEEDAAMEAVMMVAEEVSTPPAAPAVNPLDIAATVRELGRVLSLLGTVSEDTFQSALQRLSLATAPLALAMAIAPPPDASSAEVLGPSVVEEEAVSEPVATAESEEGASPVETEAAEVARDAADEAKGGDSVGDHALTEMPIEEDVSAREAAEVIPATAEEEVEVEATVALSVKATEGAADLDHVTEASPSSPEAEAAAAIVDVEAPPTSAAPAPEAKEEPTAVGGGVGGEEVSAIVAALIKLERVLSLPALQGIARSRGLLPPPPPESAAVPAAAEFLEKGAVVAPATEPDAPVVQEGTAAAEPAEVTTEAEAAIILPPVLEPVVAEAKEAASAAAPPSVEEGDGAEAPAAVKEGAVAPEAPAVRDTAAAVAADLVASALAELEGLVAMPGGVHSEAFKAALRKLEEASAPPAAAAAAPAEVEGAEGAAEVEEVVPSAAAAAAEKEEEVVAEGGTEWDVKAPADAIAGNVEAAVAAAPVAPVEEVAPETAVATDAASVTGDEVLATSPLAPSEGTQQEEVEPPAAPTPVIDLVSPSPPAVAEFSQAVDAAMMVEVAALADEEEPSAPAVLASLATVDAASSVDIAAAACQLLQILSAPNGSASPSYVQGQIQAALQRLERAAAAASTPTSPEKAVASASASAVATAEEGAPAPVVIAEVPPVVAEEAEGIEAPLEKEPSLAGSGQGEDDEGIEGESAVDVVEGADLMLDGFGNEEGVEGDDEAVMMVVAEPVEELPLPPTIATSAITSTAALAAAQQALAADVGKAEAEAEVMGAEMDLEEAEFLETVAAVRAAAARMSGGAESEPPLSAVAIFNSMFASPASLASPSGGWPPEFLPTSIAESSCQAAAAAHSLQKSLQSPPPSLPPS